VKHPVIFSPAVRALIESLDQTCEYVITRDLGVHRIVRRLDATNGVAFHDAESGTEIGLQFGGDFIRLAWAEVRRLQEAASKGSSQWKHTRITIEWLNAQDPKWCPNDWHDSAPARARGRMDCPECPKEKPSDRSPVEMVRSILHCHPRGAEQAMLDLTALGVDPDVLNQAWSEHADMLRKLLAIARGKLDGTAER
jgi:hypothetical protein